MHNNSNSRNYNARQVLQHRAANFNAVGKQAARTSSLHKPLVSANSTPATTATENMTSSSGSDHTIDELHAMHHSRSAFNNQHAAGAAANKHYAHTQQQHHHHWNSLLNQNNLSASSQNFFASPPQQHLPQHGVQIMAGKQQANLSHFADPNCGVVEASSSSRFLLGILYTVAQILLFAVLALWLYWATQHDDGFGWQADRKQQFNTHAMLMLTGFVFFNIQAMLVFRSFSCCGKVYTKILHSTLHVLAASAISLGLVLGFAAQENIGANSKPIMHFYSLHAWIGIGCVALFCLQFLFGFCSFLVCSLCCGNKSNKFRAALMPIHKTFGLTIMSLAIAACLTGLLQTARSRLSSKLNKIDYHELAEPALIINVLGVCLVLLAVIVPYIIRNLNFNDSCGRSNSPTAMRRAANLQYAAAQQLNAAGKVMHR